jgi:hypothetical protein
LEILLDSNKNLAKIRILLGPIDWGLGHATRCIPLIHEFHKQNIEVIVCGEGPVSVLIQQEFPEIKILSLRGYQIKYNAHKKGFILKMILQLPKIYRAARREHRFLKKIVPEYEINGIISDNRLGFYHKKCSSVFITHQLRILSGWNWMDALIQKINYHFIYKFNECWIPDEATENNFAGKLSHPLHLPKIPVKYLGVLSRFKKNSEQKRMPLTILLSGPEPQRTLFENIIVEQLKEINFPVTLVRGLPQQKKPLLLPYKNVIQHHHLTGKELNRLLEESEMVIARSGYSTIMDLLTIKQKAILVPTPGQTEQEYLATHLFQHHYFYTVSQNHFNLKNEIKKANEFDFKLPSITEMNRRCIFDWLSNL